MIWLVLGLATLASCALVQRLPILARFRRASLQAHRAMRLIANPAVSDHWKERALPRYALRLGLDSLTGFGLLVVALAPFLVLVAIDQAWPQGIWAALLDWRGLAFVMAVALACLAVARMRSTRSAPATVDASGYSALSRTLHRLGLARPRQVEMLFDLESATAPPPPAGADAGRHVFVAGLARAGTTALTRAIHASGAFASLTYRDMPFVAAPNLWSRLASRSRREMARTERAHGDGVMVDFDSPEALEEPFWRAFCGEAYIRPDTLLPHEVEAETRQRYRTFVGHVLARHGRGRYLAKNNNNLLRLDAIVETFPNAVVLVPFRDPFAQARSLQRQHARFAASPDPFVRDYMTWLVHHEFGQDHRPFVIGSTRPQGSPATLDYWLALWVSVHRHLLARAEAGGEAVVPVAYEDLCAGDGLAWQALCRRIGIAPDAGTFRPAAAVPAADASPSLRREAEGLYLALLALSHGRLGLGQDVPGRARAVA